MTSDDNTSAGAPSFIMSPNAPHVTYRCGRCQGQNGTLVGCGIRLVLGLRQRVCPKCKGEINKRDGNF